MISQINKPSRWSSTLNADPVQLWSGIREGNRVDLSKLFCMYYTLLLNYGCKIVPRENLVKDSIQELFMTLWERRNHINEAYSPKSYLLRSLRRNLLRNLVQQKNNSNRNKVYVNNFFEEVNNVEESIIHFEFEQEKKEQLIKAIHLLNRRQKEAIFLKYYEGLSNTEIANVMDINRQSVYNHVSKAIGNLKEFVQVL